MSESLDLIREQLVRILNWQESHVGFDKAIAGLPVEQRGSRAPGFPYSPWQLLEHMRLAQHDLREFCFETGYTQELTWPDDYWPSSPAPPDEGAWDDSVTNFQGDREALKQLVRDTRISLTASVPTGTSTQTYLRAVLLVTEHTAYHVGQLVAVRRALRVWP
jgi:hypothetical protein